MPNHDSHAVESLQTESVSQTTSSNDEDRLNKDKEPPAFYAVAFYPYSALGEEPAFAIASLDGRSWICRPAVDHSDVDDPAKDIDVLNLFRDEEPDERYNALCWSKEHLSGTPLLCLAGEKGKIKVLDALTGKLQKTFVGHGAPILALATHPVTPRFIASASEDFTVRLWDVDLDDENLACVLMCAGGAHRAGVIDIAFHSTGRFLLSCGFDHQVNMWALPNLLDGTLERDNVTVIHFPHFSTREVHTHRVDWNSVDFYGDLIVSRAMEENCIRIWRIHGFEALTVMSEPSRYSAPAPTPGKSATRSAFGKGLTILLTLDCPNSDPWFLRFGLFNRPPQRTALAMGNVTSEIFFWDLQDVEQGRVSSVDTLNGQRVIGSPIQKHTPQNILNPSHSRGKLEVEWSNVTWSRDGKWCVAVGNRGSIAVMKGREGGT
ncbi:MAG: hypothetical protein M1828_006617 [Chrysothrix sp. TS-e1954]|nr:MAG: hypothetical protein M1828_006617 [Chrysothrix sp. TS-e1954]